MGIASILLLVLAAATQPCSSAQLRGEQFPRFRRRSFPRLRSRGRVIPVPDQYSKLASTVCRLAAKAGFLPDNAASEMAALADPTLPGAAAKAAAHPGMAAANKLMEAANKAVACCKEKVPAAAACAEKYKKEFEAAAPAVTGSLSLPLPDVKVAGAIVVEAMNLDFTGASRHAARWLCMALEEAEMTKKAAAKAKDMIDHGATCLTTKANTPDLDAEVAAHSPVVAAAKAAEDAESQANMDPKQVEQLMEASEDLAEAKEDLAVTEGDDLPKEKK